MGFKLSNTVKSGPEDRESDRASNAGGADTESGSTDDGGQREMLAFQAGDDEAFDRIVVQHEGSVRRYLYRYLGDESRSMDLSQEVFIRVFRSRARYEPSARFRTWLFMIATRLALNEIRGVRRRRRVISDTQESTYEDAGASLAERSVDDNAASPMERIEHQELEDVVDQLVDALPPNQRAALILSRSEDLSYREIAETLDVTVTSVKSLLVRARETLRHGLKPYLERGELRASPRGEDGRRSTGRRRYSTEPRPVSRRPARSANPLTAREEPLTAREETETRPAEPGSLS